MANNVKNKKRSKGFFIRLISGISLALIAVTTSVSVMVPSYVKWKNYYDDVMAEKAEKERLNALPLEFLGISAELDKTIKYYDNETADPEKSDFIVRANFTEKGKAFSKRVSVDDYEMIVPEDFAKKGGTIKFTYTYTPEKKDGETETPDSITKETELTIKLIEPDETVFKIVKMPTFTEAGYAENIKGAKKDLEPLNMTDYDYEEKTSISIAKFTHKASGIVIKKAITNNLMIDSYTGTRKDYNNINCHFANDIEGLKIAFIDNAFTLTAEGEQAVSIGSINGENTTIEFKTGEFSIKGTINADKLILKSHVKLNITGKITSNNMIAEKDSELNINFLKTGWYNGITIGENGFIKLYGKAKFTGSGENTAIDLGGGASLSLNADSRVVGENCQFFVGTFVANKDGLKLGYLRVPEDSVAKDGNYYVGENCILDLSLCKNKYLCNIDIRKVSDKYILVTKPDTTNPGVAQGPEGNNITLPVLNFNDYKVKINGTTLTFFHKETSIDVDLSFDKTNEIKIDGLTINYSEDTGYKFVVDENKAIELTGNFSTNSLTISGKGSISITGSLTISKSLLVENGSTLKVTATKDDAIIVKNKGNLHLFGTVVINAVAGKTGICFAEAESAIYLKDTSRVTVSGGAFTIGHFNTSNSAKVYYPKNATNADNKITSADGNVLLSYGGLCKIDFVAEM